MQAVEVEPIKTNPCRIRGEPIIVFAQPSDKIKYVGVTPHPAWKSSEAAQRVIRVFIVVETADISVNTVSVRPFGFDCYNIKAFLFDQALCDLRALAIELMGAVRSFAKQNKMRVADQLHQGIVILGRARE